MLTLCVAWSSSFPASPNSLHGKLGQRSEKQTFAGGFASEHLEAEP